MIFSDIVPNSETLYFGHFDLKIGHPLKTFKTKNRACRILVLSFFIICFCIFVSYNLYLFEETRIHCSIAKVDKRTGGVQDDWHQKDKFCCNQTLHFDRTNPIF